MNQTQIVFIHLTAFLILLVVTKTVYADYFDMGDGTVYDDELHLLWQQSDDAVLRFFADADGYCNNLSLGGRENWQLPSVEILSSLVDKNYNPTINPIFSSQASKYYSSTTYEAISTGPGGVGKGSTVVDLVDFNTGDITSESTYIVNYISAVGYTRCVIVGYNPLAKPLDPAIFFLLKSDSI